MPWNFSQFKHKKVLTAPEPALIIMDTEHKTRGNQDMPQVREVTVYTFDELDESAKERARDWYRSWNFDDWYWSESVVEGFATICEKLGLDIKQKTVRLMGGGTRKEPSVYWDGLNGRYSTGFEGDYAYAKNSVKAVKEYAPQDEELHDIASKLQAIQRKNFYQLTARIELNNWNNMLFSVERDSPAYQDLSEGAEEALQECLYDFAHWLERSLRDEYEYHMSNEVVDEGIIANEYTFHENGERA
jgi:hypothetical protein